MHIFIFFQLMIFLAPLHGFTDFTFRNVYQRHYSGIDVAISPFIPLTQGEKGVIRKAKDVCPEWNKMPVIPQLLGNDSTLFVLAAKVLANWGYEKLNWNLGCPVNGICRKKRGSGLLPFPELIRDILEKTLPNIEQQLSVKIRLGYKSENEINELIPVLNDFPLEYIIVHPRIATQMYDGNVRHAVLSKCLPLFKHEIIYNGDISSLSDFKNIKQLHPTIKKWMIGRGIFSNPELPELIKNNNLLSVKNANEHFLTFILDYYDEVYKLKNNEVLTINKIKDLWKYISIRFTNSTEIFGIISHLNSLKSIKESTIEIITNYPLKLN